MLLTEQSELHATIYGENRVRIVMSVFTVFPRKIWVPPVALEAKEVGFKVGRDTYCLLYTLLWPWKYLSYTFFFNLKDNKKRTIF